MTDRRPIAIITGANRGIGRSTALALAKSQVDSIITYRSHAEEAQSVAAMVAAKGAKAVPIRLNTREVASFEAFASDVGEALSQWHRDKFDYLVNLAGAAEFGPFSEITETQFDEMMEVHFKGVYFLTQKLLPQLADGGKIVNVSSGLTRSTRHGASAYASAKGAVEVLTRYLACELGSRGITVNTVAPGPIATDFGSGAARDDEELRALLASESALGRVGEPDDVGSMIAALVSGSNNWVSGQRIEVSGGSLL